MKLYSFFRSSASYRVRIALNLKGIEYEYVPCHLRKGEQRSETFLALNPHGLVPMLELDGAVITQSLAIIEYLDECYPQHPLLPREQLGRARVRGIALSAACDIHPLNNLRVLNYLEDVLAIDESARNRWYQHWVKVGFEALEQQLAQDRDTGEYCHGDAPTLADVCLVPQVANAERFHCDLSAYPTITRINQACLCLEPFRAAMPKEQPDAE